MLLIDRIHCNLVWNMRSLEIESTFLFISLLVFALATVCSHGCLSLSLLHIIVIELPLIGVIKCLQHTRVLWIFWIIKVFINVFVAAGLHRLVASAISWRRHDIRHSLLHHWSFILINSLNCQVCKISEISDLIILKRNDWCVSFERWRKWRTNIRKSHWFKNWLVLCGV